MKLSTLTFKLFSGIAFSTALFSTTLFSSTVFALPSESNPTKTAAQAQAAPSQPTPSTAPTEKIVNQVNINSASAEELAKGLNGIGLSKAKKIVEYREKMGQFISIEQLKEVSGIGQATLDKNAGKIAL